MNLRFRKSDGEVWRYTATPWTRQEFGDFRKRHERIDPPPVERARTLSAGHGVVVRDPPVERIGSCDWNARRACRSARYLPHSEYYSRNDQSRNHAGKHPRNDLRSKLEHEIRADTVKLYESAKARRLRPIQRCRSRYARLRRRPSNPAGDRRQSYRSQESLAGALSHLNRRRRRPR